MEVTFTIPQLASLAVTLLLAFFGFAVGVWKIISRIQAKDCEVEKDLLRLRAELPVDYVRREDWIRNQTVIEAKLDGLATKLEGLKEGRHHVC
jgi:hypothetical protein